MFGAVLCEAAYAVIGKRLTSALSGASPLINLWGVCPDDPPGL